MEILPRIKRPVFYRAVGLLGKKTEKQEVITIQAAIWSDEPLKVGKVLLVMVLNHDGTTTNCRATVADKDQRGSGYPAAWLVNLDLHVNPEDVEKIRGYLE